MNRFLKIAYLVIFFTALALPSLHFFGVKESWHKIYGAERIPALPALTLKGFVDRSYQSTLTEHFSKAFFLRSTFYTTSRQITGKTLEQFLHYMKQTWIYSHLQKI